ncbi:sperm motility kinase Z-like [Arvicanthis niloticus]|uniref:sperm motility kinase Z-like n=1 Tax=Arvicanthis niloticus TaxID=61156 RepID=UPI00402B7546
MLSRELEASCHEGNTLARDYYILGTLDKGSFAEVKVALHLMTQTMVAIKILNRCTKMDFLVVSEVELMKTLHHSNIVQLLQIIDTRHKTYLVMEYASKGSLQKHINKCGRLQEEEARTIFTELSLAIDYIHSQNIVHRDIKAENILLDWDGHVKLTDFGLGKRLASGEQFRGFCGTPQYCAPEVFHQKPYDGLPADIWSLGVLLYYLVVGQLPFREKVHSKIKYLIQSQNYWIPCRLSPDLQDLLKRLFTLDPTTRPSIKEVLAHPWLRRDQGTLTSSEKIPQVPEPNIAFEMFLMGHKVQELRYALKERKYSRAMATYLILKRKGTLWPQFCYDAGQGGTLDPTKAHSLPCSLRGGSSASTIPTFTSPSHSELPGLGRKGHKRRHSVPPTLSSLKSSFLENTSPLQGFMPHVGKDTFREKGGRISSTTSPSRKRKETTTTITSSSGTTGSLFTLSQTSTAENTQDGTSESSEASYAYSSTSSWESTTSSPFPSKKFQEENTGSKSSPDSSTSSWVSITSSPFPSKKLLEGNTGSKTFEDFSSSSWGSTTWTPFPSKKIQEENTSTEFFQDSISPSWEIDHHGPLPMRRWGWKGLKKRISKALRRLCCCLPATNNNIVAASEECFRDSG